MTNYTIYKDATGEILRNAQFVISDPAQLAAAVNANVQSDEKFIEGTFASSDYYVANKQAVAKPVRPGPNYVFDYNTKAWQLDAASIAAQNCMRWQFRAALYHMGLADAWDAANGSAVGESVAYYVRGSAPFNTLPGALALSAAQLDGLFADALTADPAAPIPKLADAAPPMVAVGASARGASKRFAAADHTHGEPPVWAKAGLKTNTSGVWVGNLDAGKFPTQPVLIIMPLAGAYSADVEWMQYTWNTAGTAQTTTPSNFANGYGIRVTFKRIRTDAITLANILQGLFQTTTGVVTFDGVARATTT